MGLMQRINDIRNRYISSGISDQALSQILGREDLAEGGLKFLASDNGKIFFSVPPTKGWRAEINWDSQYEAVLEGLKMISKEYGLKAEKSNVGFFINGTYVFGSKKEHVGIAHLHPNYLVFDDLKARPFTMLEAGQRDDFLKRVVDIAYQAPSS